MCVCACVFACVPAACDEESVRSAYGVNRALSTKAWQRPRSFERCQNFQLRSKRSKETKKDLLEAQSFFAVNYPPWVPLTEQPLGNVPASKPFCIHFIAGMASFRSVASAALALAAHEFGANADIYMHNPPGSNNRNRERNQNRNNANRLFDSQNNDKGGYPWRGDRELLNSSDAIAFYEGSTLRVEWTNQHACGDDPTTFCTMTLQYACEDTMPNLRDGYPSGPLESADSQYILYKQATFVDNNKDGTTTITEATKDNFEFGMHENFTWFSDCGKRRRNKGLYTADRILNLNSARSTRQNPNGGQRGFECPEERDYYPYWHPTQWKDIAVFVTDESWCDYYREHSQNTADRQYCLMTTTPSTTDKMIPIEEQECLQYNGKWVTEPAWNIDPPECAVHPRSRQNHLGNVGPVSADGLPETPYYDWTIPEIPADMDTATCVLRIRYNISTGDYDSMGGFVSTSTESTGDTVFGSANNCGEILTPPAPVNTPAPAPRNGRSSADSAAASAATPSPCSNVLKDHNRPLYNRPYVTVFDSKPQLSLAINTDQTGRTFQDRSHVFNITKRPSGVSSTASIWNVNVRGRRGNIVQCYPAVEYDFTPADLEVNMEDYIHFQWSGSDYNQAINPNNGEGWKYSDRHNLVQVDNMNYNVPVKYSEQKMFFADEDTAQLFALQNTQANLAVVRHADCCRVLVFVPCSLLLLCLRFSWV